jgi:YggT family protein
MAAIIGFIFFVIDAVLGLFVLALIVYAILSWLVAFDVINYRNRFVASLSHALDTIISPVLAPLRAVIPPLGGMDVTPIIAWILIAGIRIYLLPASKAALLTLTAGTYY